MAHFDAMGNVCNIWKHIYINIWNNIPEEHEWYSYWSLSLYTRQKTAIAVVWVRAPYDYRAWKTIVSIERTSKPTQVIFYFLFFLSIQAHTHSHTHTYIYTIIIDWNNNNNHHISTYTLWIHNKYKQCLHYILNIVIVSISEYVVYIFSVCEARRL